MYYEEKIINDVLCTRGTPDGEFIPLSQVALTARIAALRVERDEARKLIEFLKAVVKDQDIPFTTETCAVLKKHIERFILADPEQ